MKKNHEQSMLIIGLACLPILLATAYYLGKQSSPVVSVVEAPKVSSPQPSATPSDVPSVQPTVSALATQKNPTKTSIDKYEGWPIYTDTVAGFTFRYAPDTYVIDKKEGSFVTFPGFSITIHNDYTGGSRREWLNSKVDNSTYDVTYEDFMVDGANALIVKASDPGSMGHTNVMIAKGKRVYLFSKDSGSESTQSIKELISAFKFL